MFSIRWGARGRVFSLPDRPDSVLFYPAPHPLAAPPCAAPTRPACSVSEFWIRQVQNWLKDIKKNCFHFRKSCTTEHICYSTCRIQNPDISRAGRVGAPGGAARRGGARLGANGTIRIRNKSLPYAKKTKKYRLNVSQEARTSEILCLPTEAQNHRLTSR